MHGDSYGSREFNSAFYSCAFPIITHKRHVLIIIFQYNYRNGNGLFMHLTILQSLFIMKFQKRKLKISQKHALKITFKS